MGRDGDQQVIPDRLLPVEAKFPSICIDCDESVRRLEPDMSLLEQLADGAAEGRAGDGHWLRLGRHELNFDGVVAATPTEEIRKQHRAFVRRSRNTCTAGPR